MNRRWIVVFLALGFLVAATAPAQQQTAAQQKAMEEAYMKHMAVTDNHALLKFFEGSWTVKATMWMMPGTPPETSDNTFMAKAVMGGRFVVGDYKGVMMGQPFEGHQINGYDNMKKKFTTFWMDNSSTSFYLLEGDYDAAAKAYNQTGRWPDPATGGVTPVRAATKVLGADAFSYELFMTMPDGKEFKTMEARYTRKK